jgi:hypothetical protein
MMVFPPPFVVLLFWLVNEFFLIDKRKQKGFRRVGIELD